MQAIPYNEQSVYESFTSIYNAIQKVEIAIKKDKLSFCFTDEYIQSEEYRRLVQEMTAAQISDLFARLDFGVYHTIQTSIFNDVQTNYEPPSCASCKALYQPISNLISKAEQ